MDSTKLFKILTLKFKPNLKTSNDDYSEPNKVLLKFQNAFWRGGIVLLDFISAILKKNVSILHDFKYGQKTPFLHI